MGTTHRIYKLKRKEVSLQKKIEIMKLLYKTLCVGKKKVFQYEFNVETPTRLAKINDKFKVLNENVQLSFKINDSNQLNNILERTNIYEKAYFYNQQKNSREKNYLSYWIDLNNELRSFSFRISLPYSSGIEKSKLEFAKILKYLVKEKLLYIGDIEIDDLSKKIIDLNSNNPSGYWSYHKGNLEFLSSGGVTFKDSNQLIPTDVRINFKEQSYYEGHEKRAIAFHESLNKYFSGSNYYVKGTIISKSNSEIFTQLSDIDFLEFNILINVDIQSKADFSVSDLEFSKNEHLTIENFDWLDGNSNHGDDKLNLWIKSANEHEFEIQISKQIEENYYKQIENIIREKLEYTGIE